jgi:hypothetical protein
MLNMTFTISTLISICRYADMQICRYADMHASNVDAYIRLVWPILATNLHLMAGWTKITLLVIWLRTVVYKIALSHEIVQPRNFWDPMVVSFSRWPCEGTKCSQ